MMSHGMWSMCSQPLFLITSDVQGCELDIDAGDRTRVRVLPLH